MASSAAPGGTTISWPASMAFPGLVSVDEGPWQFKGTETKAEWAARLTGKIDFTDHPMIEYFRTLKSVAKAVPEDDHSVADSTALSRRLGGDRAVGLSRDGAVLRRSRQGLRQGGARFRRSGLHAACSSTRPSWPISATPRSVTI